MTTFAAAAALLIAPFPVQADTYDDHNYLWQTLENAGVRIHINPEYCWEDHELLGAYIGKYHALIVCQENKITPDQAVDWTEEDLDTFRHEAQHFIQDCMIGSNFDHVLGSVYKEPVDFGIDVLSLDVVQSIVDLYSDKDSKTQILEIEAFAVAAVNDPIEQARDVQKYCF